MKKKIIAVFSAVSMIASLIAAGTEKFSAAEENKTIKILSIGDSITDGYGTEGSYRKFLYKNLTDKGYSVDMTGPNNSWGDGQYSDAGESFSYDAAHCGFSGYSICEYSGRNGILETISKGKYLEEYVPDIVILQIGTNDIIDNYDIDNAGERLDTLVSYILGNISEDSALFVTTVPYLAPNEPDVYQWFLNYRHSADWTQQFNDEEAEKAVISQVDNYNRQVSELVSRKQSEGVKNIFAGDINSVLDDLKLQLKDGVHPNDTGYRLMGEYWTNLLTDYLAENSEPDNKAEKGDANSDGSVTATDIVLLQNRLLGLTDTENISEGADMNDDGKINILDLILLKNLLLR